MCDKENCNCGSNPCCGDCEPWNCIEQAVNDVWSTKEGQIEQLVERAETAAENSEASAQASAGSAAEAKEFRDEAEQAATTAVAAEGIVVGVANSLQDTADKLKQIADELGTAIAGISVVTWYYTAVSDNQTVIPVPTDKNQVDVQAIYIEGARRDPNRGFSYDALNKEIILAEGIPLGMEISIIIGTYSDNPNDFANTLASNNGASLIGTSSGKTVQAEINQLHTDVSALATHVDTVETELKDEISQGDQQLQNEINALTTVVNSRGTYSRAAEWAKVMADGGQVGGRAIGFAYCGDSTVYGATVGDLATQNPYNAPASFAKGLNLLYGIAPNVHNFGISGTTMKQFLEGTDGSGTTYEAKLQSTAWNAYDVVLCNHCINDSQLNNNIHEYRLNVIKFVQLTRKYNKTPILVTPNINPPILIIDQAKSKRLGMYVDVMRKVAADFEVDLVDNYYYFMRSLNTFSASELVGDGAHPTNIGYIMCGMNACIPFITVQTLKEVGDFAGLTNTTFYDNMTEYRQLVNRGGKYDIVLSGNKHATELQGVNFPVVLDAGTADTVLAPTVIQWSSGMEVSLTWNGQLYPMHLYYTGPIQMNDGNRNNAVNWNAVAMPSYCRLPAGLAIISMLMNPAYAGVGNGMGISGATLLQKAEAAPGGFDVDASRWMAQPFGAYSRITGIFDWSMGEPLSIQCNSGAALLTIKHNGTTLVATLDGTDTVIGTATIATKYNYSIKFNGNAITIVVGSVQVNLTTNYPIPEGYIRNESQIFTVYRGNR